MLLSHPTNSAVSSVWSSRRGCWGMTLRWVGQRTVLARIQRGDEGKRWTDKPCCVAHKGLKQLQGDDNSISSSDLPTSSALGHSIYWHGPECVQAKLFNVKYQHLQRSLLNMFYWECMLLKAKKNESFQGSCCDFCIKYFEPLARGPLVHNESAFHRRSPQITFQRQLFFNLKKEIRWLNFTIFNGKQPLNQTMGERNSGSLTVPLKRVAFHLQVLTALNFHFFCSL